MSRLRKQEFQLHPETEDFAHPAAQCRTRDAVVARTANCCKEGALELEVRRALIAPSEVRIDCPRFDLSQFTIEKIPKPANRLSAVEHYRLGLFE